MTFIDLLKMLLAGSLFCHNTLERLVVKRHSAGEELLNVPLVDKANFPLILVVHIGAP